MRSGVIVAALSATNGPALRADSAWMARATSSLPEPDGPMIMTRLLVGATRSIVWRSWLIADDMPIRSNGLAAALLQVGDLALELRGLQRALGDQDQPVGLERLLDEVVGAAADRRDGGLDVAVPGDHHHRQVGMHGS